MIPICNCSITHWQSREVTIREAAGGLGLGFKVHSRSSCVAYAAEPRHHRCLCSVCTSLC